MSSGDAKLRMYCPRCCHSLRVRREYAGHEASCPHCDLSLLVPRHFRVRCRHCAAVGRVEIEHLGELVGCKQCGQDFRANASAHVVEPLLNRPAGRHQTAAPTARSEPHIELIDTQKELAAERARCALLEQAAIVASRQVDELRSALHTVKADREAQAIAVEAARQATAEAERRASELEVQLERRKIDMETNRAAARADAARAAETRSAAESRNAELAAALEKGEARIADLQRELERVRSAPGAARSLNEIVDVALEDWE